MLRLFRFLSHAPLWLLQAVGWLLGWLAWLLSPTYRRRWDRNTRLAQVEGAARRASVGQAGMLVAELPRLWFGRRVPIHWDGAQHIDAALAQGSGMLFLTPHLGCFEITAQAYARRYGASGLPGAKPMTVLYRPPRQHWLLELVESARGRPGLATAPTTLAGVRQLIQALKAGEAVGLLPDQVPPDGLGVWAPFFGEPAYTMTLSARFARTPGTVVLVAWGERLSWGRGFRVHVQPLAEVLPEPLAAEPAAIAAQFNRAMEVLVRRCPGQYLWGYDRYKEPRGGGRPPRAPA